MHTMVGFLGFPSIFSSFTEGNHLILLLVLNLLTCIKHPLDLSQLTGRTHRHRLIMVETIGIEPMNLLNANQTLSQLS